VSLALSGRIRNFIDQDPGSEKVSVDTKASGDRSIPQLLTAIPTLPKIFAKQLRPFLWPLSLDAQIRLSSEQFD
jgi:hypothetical protein